MATTTNTDRDPSVLNEVSGNRETSGASKSKLKSRSLEPLTSLAMWCEEVIQIELVKGDRGLGFSILDYQDPMNKEETVVVIRSLVPGGETHPFPADIFSSKLCGEGTIRVSFSEFGP